MLESNEANINSIELVIWHTFPEESVAIVSVNEIMREPSTLPASEGNIPS